MKKEEIINFYEARGYKVVDKITQLDVIIKDTTIMFHQIFFDVITIKNLEDSLN